MSSTHAWFVGRIETINPDNSFDLFFEFFNSEKVEKDKIRPKSDLKVGDKVVILFERSLLQGVIVQVLAADDTYSINIGDGPLVFRKRNEIGLLHESSEDTPGSDIASGASPASASASASAPLVPASSTPTLSLTEDEKSSLKTNSDYQAYLIAQEVTLSDNPKQVLRDELNKFTSRTKIGDDLLKHIENTDWDRTVNKRYNNKAILQNIDVIIGDSTGNQPLFRFVTDYKTAEQELLRDPNISSYLIYRDIGVHSSDAFVKAVCDRMQRRLSEPIKGLLREKRKVLYKQSFDATPKAIPSVADLNQFFEADPDKATIYLFINMIQSMLTIEPLLKAHYESFGRALQKTFKTPGLYFNKSRFTKGLTGSKTVSDLVNKDRTKTEIKDLLKRLDNTKIEPEEKDEILKQIKANIDKYKRIIGEDDEHYNFAKTYLDRMSSAGKVKMDSSFWKSFKRRLNTFLGYSGGKKTKHHKANKKTRRPHVMRRKTHHKKRRPVRTRRQLQVRR